MSSLPYFRHRACSYYTIIDSIDTALRLMAGNVIQFGGGSGMHQPIGSMPEMILARPPFRSETDDTSVIFITTTGIQICAYEYDTDGLLVGIAQLQYGTCSPGGKAIIRYFPPTLMCCRIKHIETLMQVPIDCYVYVTESMYGDRFAFARAFCRQIESKHLLPDGSVRIVYADHRDFTFRYVDVSYCYEKGQIYPYVYVVR